MSASGPPTLLAWPMTYSRLTKLFAYDWKVAKSPVGRETALIMTADAGTTATTIEQDTFAIRG